MSDNPTTLLPENLPEPSAEAWAHSRKLEAVIKQHIHDAGGRISFQAFMQAALYEPGLGYYRCGTQKFGAGGDFITAPESSALFGECLANFITQSEVAGSVLEVGAGSGVLAVSILQALEAKGQLPDQYFILELSAELQQRQHDAIATVLPHLVEKVIWLDCFPKHFTGVVVANELLDAMPVRRFRLLDDELAEQYVIVTDEHFAYDYEATTEPRITQRIAELKTQTSINEVDEFHSEVNFVAEDWIKSLADSLDTALVVLIDYGYPRGAYYHAQRHMGTLMCHYQHHAHDDPLILSGIQDITAHVDFTAMADAALEAGMEINGFATQAHFLLNLGLLDQAGQDQTNLPEFLQTTGEIKRLTLPGEMGESFKVVVVSKDYNGSVPGFTINDIRHLL